jgi:hypothetical protein
VPPAAVTPDRPIAAVGEPVAVDVDAHTLTEFENLRLILVPMGTPDAVDDETTFFADAKAVAPTQMQVLLNPTTPVPYEIRLYAAPRTGFGWYKVAARTGLFVTPPK